MSRPIRLTPYCFGFARFRTGHKTFTGHLNPDVLKTISNAAEWFGR